MKLIVQKYGGSSVAGYTLFRTRFGIFREILIVMLKQVQHIL
jgi:aspartokinase